MNLIIVSAAKKGRNEETKKRRNEETKKKTLVDHLLLSSLSFLRFFVVDTFPSTSAKQKKPESVLKHSPAFPEKRPCPAEPHANGNRRGESVVIAVDVKLRKVSLGTNR